jgi:hypothetical protein
MRSSRSPALMAMLGLLTVAGACTPRPGASSSPVGGGVDVTGHVSAGPTCPVVTVPPQSGCQDRPVKGAELLFTDASGTQVARVTSGADGSFSITLPPGRYRVVPQPFDGLMGTAADQELMVRAGTPPPPLTISYDTGIR